MNNKAISRLDTWKEIGAYFGRDERTVKRWESLRGLPVHRVPGGSRGTVYAYVHELDGWLRSRDLKPETAPPIEPPPTPASPSPSPARRRSILISALAAVVVLTVAAGAWSLHPVGAARAQAALDPATAQLYDKGLHDWNSRTPEGLRMAVTEFNQAIGRAPNYAPAYVGLANCYNLLREYTVMQPSEAYPRARAAALRAIALDDRSAGGHRALAFEEFYWEWDVLAAEREFRRALALEPDAAISHHWYANFLLMQRRFDDARREIDRAQALDPESSSILADKAHILQAAGRFDEAQTALRQLVQTDPSYMSPHVYLADLDLQRGDIEGYLSEEAIADRLLQDPSRTTIRQAAERGWRTAGRQGMFQAMLAAQLSLLPAGRTSSYEVARTYALLGDDAAAVRFLRRARSLHEAPFLGAAIDWPLDRLRAQPGLSRNLIALSHA